MFISERVSGSFRLFVQKKETDRLLRSFNCIHSVVKWKTLHIGLISLVFCSFDARYANNKPTTESFH